MKIILLGAPGAGKGTQAAIINKRLNIPMVSTGNIIRDAMKFGTQMGIEAKKYVDKGQLVPDDVVIGIVKDRISENDCRDGFILDGFPRTIAQARALDSMEIEIDKVISIEVEDDLIYNRMAGRRVCSSCGATYNINTDCRPKVDGICDACGKSLVHRKDDDLATVKERLQVYYRQTEPLKDYYKKKGVLLEIDGGKPLKETSTEIIEIIEASK